MDVKVRVFMFAFGVLWILLILRLVKNRRLWDRHALPWLAFGLAMVTIPAVVDWLDRIIPILGFGSQPNFFFLAAMLGILFILLQAALEITALMRRSRSTVQELALLEERLRQVEERLRLSEAAAAPRGPENPGSA